MRYTAGTASGRGSESGTPATGEKGEKAAEGGEEDEAGGDEGEEETAGAGVERSRQADALLARLPTCVSKDLVSKLSVFINLVG